MNGPEVVGPRGRVLVLTFSRIVADARVLKQVAHLRADHDVVSVGYGPPPDGVAHHIQIPDRLHNRLDGRLITLRAYRAAYWAQPAIRWMRDRVPRGSAEVIVANDLESVPLALWWRPLGGVHADLHEYFPRWHESDPAWLRRIGPYQHWWCRRVLPRVAAVTTVSSGLAAEYTRVFGVPVGVVTNATPYVDLAPTPTRSPLRLVHSGACLRDRHLEVMVQAAMRTTTPVTFDLYLTPNHPVYLEELRVLAGERRGVTIREPLAYSDLIRTLNDYDVGLFVLPPVTFSYRHALPNKIFDYVQARLAVVVGPSPEMAALVSAHGLGVVADGFEVADLVRVLDVLDLATVQGAKAAASAAAPVLSDGAASGLWVRSVERLLHGASSRLPGLVR